ncbi:50S ribosomal protein L25 [Haloferula sp. A504]|uniref:50S ribosomal protein L25 n=1 Tax=Haloferula sp. A504 TaxID=3373601 RepID=UPI0031C92533|nr:50S ribosomal protein L25 [Verrucomicrobiaceae bacterium E54]
MAKKHTLKAELRARTGSGLLKQMRREGWLPSVLYGKDSENKNLKVDAKTFRELLGDSESENILINLAIEGGASDLAFLQDIQYDPLTGEALHADFLAVNEKTELNASVPVHLIGNPVGVKAGGILEQGLHTLDVTCLATNLPESLEFDISALDEGDSLHIGDVEFPAGVKPNYDAEVVIAHIGRPALLVTEEEGGEDGAVPVIGETQAAEGEEAAAEEQPAEA